MFRSKRFRVVVKMDIGKAHKWNISPNKLNGASLLKLSPMRERESSDGLCSDHLWYTQIVACGSNVKNHWLLQFYSIIFMLFVLLLLLSLLFPINFYVRKIVCDLHWNYLQSQRFWLQYTMCIRVSSLIFQFISNI